MSEFGWLLAFFATHPSDEAFDVMSKASNVTRKDNSERSRPRE